MLLIQFTAKYFRFIRMRHFLSQQSDNKHDMMFQFHILPNLRAIPIAFSIPKMYAGK